MSNWYDKLDKESGKSIRCFVSNSNSNPLNNEIDGDKLVIANIWSRSGDGKDVIYTEIHSGNHWRYAVPCEDVVLYFFNEYVKSNPESSKRNYKSYLMSILNRNIDGSFHALGLEEKYNNLESEMENKCLEVGKCYYGELMEINFQHKEDGHVLTEEVYSININHIYSSKEVDEILLANMIDELQEERHILSLDKIKSKLSTCLEYASKIEKSREDARQKALDYESQYEKVEYKYGIPFIVNGIIVCDDEDIDEPEREFQSDKDYRKNGVVDNKYKIEYNLSHCGINKEEAINNFIEIIDEDELRRARKSIADFLQYEDEYHEAMASRYPEY